MPESDALLSPTDLHRRIKKFGPTFQANHRKAGDFPIEHVVIGNRIFYRKSSVEAFLAGQAQTAAPAADAPAPKGLTLGDDSLAETLARIIRQGPTSEEVRTRVAQLLAGGESGERLWNAGGPDEAA
jgi:hypothetical protein